MLRGFGLLLASACVVWAPCRAAWGEGVIGERRRQAMRASLVGEWACEVGKVKVRLRLAQDGTATLDGRRGRYEVDENRLTLALGDERAAYQFELTGDQLALTGGELAQPLKFARQPEIEATWAG